MRGGGGYNEEDKHVLLLSNMFNSKPCSVRETTVQTIMYLKTTVMTGRLHVFVMSYKKL